MRKLNKEKTKALLVAVLFLIIILFTTRTIVARGVLGLGNQFFGGVLPHSLQIADTSYKTALFFDAEVPDAWHQRARIAFLRGDFEDALVKINKQLEIHGDSFMASYYIRGLIYGYDEQFEKAEQDFVTFLKWDPTSWAANNDLAWIYFAQGKFKETKAQSEVGLAYNQNNPWLHMMHAMAVYNLGDVDSAYEELLKAKEDATKLVEDDWAKAYPGNDPKIAGRGLSEFKKTIERNIELVHNKKINL